MSLPVVSYRFPVTGKYGLAQSELTGDALQSGGVAFRVSFVLQGRAGVFMHQLVQFFGDTDRCCQLFDFLRGRFSMRFLNWVARNIQHLSVPGGSNLSQSFRRTCDAFSKRYFDFFHRGRGQTDVTVSVKGGSSVTTCVAQMNCARWSFNSGFFETVLRHEATLLDAYGRRSRSDRRSADKSGAVADHVHSHEMERSAITPQHGVCVQTIDIGAAPGFQRHDVHQKLQEGETDSCVGAPVGCHR